MRNTIRRSWTFAIIVLLSSPLQPWAESPGPSSRRTAWVISEIMYHPLTRSDGKNLEYVELYNSALIAEDLGGHRLSGAWDFTFPSGTKVPAGGFLLVGANPEDLQSVSGLSGVLGGFTNSLPNDSGTLRLLNPAGAVLLNVQYNDTPPWPTAPDGAGHSLVLANPSYGEEDARAWSAGALIGGSPGQADPTNLPNAPVVQLNEILAHTDDPQLDFIEIYNPTSISQDLSQCRLTDAPDKAGLRIPANTVLPPHGFIAFDQLDLGFALSAAGEAVFLFDADGLRVIDAIRFPPQANGVAYGRSPDGAATWSQLVNPSPHLQNSVPRQAEVVINEIFYHPPGDDNDEEFVELYNPGPAPVDLTGWRFTDGVSFVFPEGTSLLRGAYLAVTPNAARFQTNYPDLHPSRYLGDYSGSLANSGERITLSRPEWLVETNLDLSLSTNLVFIPVDEVAYRDGGRWGLWSDGGGSSLELVDPRADNRLPDAWADSDETAKSEWTPIEFTGVLDLGVGIPDSLQVLLQGAGTCLIDDIEVLNPAQQNSLANGAFDNGTGGWNFQGTHDASGWESAEGATSPGSLRIATVARGDTGANRVHSPLVPALSAGSTATIRASARWLRGNSEVLLRLRGNYLEAFGAMTVPKNLGTPGAPNSRQLANHGSSINEVRHAPVLPVAAESLRVSARVQDPDGVASVSLQYRVDPSPVWITLPMADDGTGGDAFASDGLFSATVPGQPAGTIIAFRVAATDAATPPRSSLSPDAAPFVENLVRFGETSPSGGLGVYRLWISAATFNRWSSRSVLDNTPLPITFVYNDERVVQGVQALYAGSPHIAPSYNNPAGNLCGYVLIFPSDEPFLGATDVVLDWPGRDATTQQEPMAYWIARELGIPFNHRRTIRLHVNGRTETERGSIYEDAQQVNSDLIASWLPDDTDGNLYKIEQWFEFADNGNRTHTGPPRLENYTTTGGTKKTARYRWNWLPRAVRGSANDFASLFTLADAANALNPQTYIRQLESLIDVEEWMRTFAVENIVVNFDAWGYDIGKNMYAYKPPQGPWRLFMWDIDWVMLASAQHGFSPTSPLMYQQPSNFGEGNRDPVVGRMYDHPALQRAYWRAIRDAVQGPLRSRIFNPRLDAMHAALTTAGVTRSAGNTYTAPTEVSNWLTQRHNFLLQQLATVDAVFSITGATPGPANTGVIEGSAPIEVVKIQVNGQTYPVTWTSVTNWQTQLPLVTGANLLDVVGLDSNDQPLPNATGQTTLSYNLPLADPSASLVINEIHYHPALPGAAFVEIFNRSTSTAFDLSGWALEGVDLSFPSGTWIAPEAFTVAANNRERLIQAHGIDTLAGAEFRGQLRNDGETLRLVTPSMDNAPGTMVDQVTYDDLPPWPPEADGLGPSLQLIDPNQDNQRPGNWGVAAQDPPDPPQTLMEITHSWSYNDSDQDLGVAWRETDYDDSAWPSGPALLYHETSPLPAPKSTPINLGARTFYFRSEFALPAALNAAQLDLTVIVDDAAIIHLNGQEWLRIGMDEGPFDHQTLASRIVGEAAEEKWLLPMPAFIRTGINVIAVEVHQGSAGSSDVVFGLSLKTAPETQPQSATPGRPNALTAQLPPLANIWINEFQPYNLTGPQDGFGDTEPWAELFNAGSDPIDLSDISLTDSEADLAGWFFPTGYSLAANQRVVVWLDGEPNQSSADALHASFRVGQTSGVLALVQWVDETPWVLDSIRYAALAPDVVFALMPDGNADDRRLLTVATPGSANTWPLQPNEVFINEWMASNQNSVVDPADGDADDWFELYNGTGTTVDLTGWFLSDDPTNPYKFTIPPGTIVPALGYLLCWADEETALIPGGSGLHVNFKLAQGGEWILLATPDGHPVDQISFGPQTMDISEGRWPDGLGLIDTLSQPTPGLSNAPPVSHATRPQFLGLEFAPDGTVSVAWTSIPGAHYRLQSTPSLLPANWQDISNDLIADGEVLSVGNLPFDPESLQFYRVYLAE